MKIFLVFLLNTTALMAYANTDLMKLLDEGKESPYEILEEAYKRGESVSLLRVFPECYNSEGVLVDSKIKGIVPPVYVYSKEIGSISESSVCSHTFDYVRKPAINARGNLFSGTPAETEQLFMFGFINVSQNEAKEHEIRNAKKLNTKTRFIIKDDVEYLETSGDFDKCPSGRYLSLKDVKELDEEFIVRSQYTCEGNKTYTSYSYYGKW